MFTTTIIASIGRPSLGRSVMSVLEQDFPAEDFEVVVVNDSGASLPGALWQRSDRVRVLESPQREKCFARNAGATVARGRYLHFLDDDDWLLPGAFRALYRAAEDSGAAWIYGGARYVDREENPLAEHHVGLRGNGFVQAVAGEWIPPGASIIRTDVFFQVGGFDPSLAVAEDKDLCRKVALRWDFAHTTIPVACFLRDRQNTTTDYRVADHYNTWSRDRVLAQRAAFRRMCQSVTDAYWAGKLTRAYLTCAWWNLRQGKLIAAVGHSLRAMTGLVIFSRRAMQPLFWTALRKPHNRPNVY